MSDLELFVVTGLPGENALRHVPFDEAAERMWEAKRCYDRDIRQHRNTWPDDRMRVLLRAALGVDR